MTVANGVHTVRFVLNGAPCGVEARPGETLLDLLRGPLGVTSPKRGCQPLGQCGSCLAIVNGEPKVTCTIPAQGATGLDVRTLEGLAQPERDLFARAFASADALQCGFCTPGIVLRAKCLLDSNPDPTRAEVAAALDEHLCRCTGYVKIVDAILLAARARRGEKTDAGGFASGDASAAGSTAGARARPAPAAMAPLPDEPPKGAVGRSLPRYQAHELALGARAFVDDLVRPGMLFGAVVLSAHARARVKRIHTEAALALPGVKAVVTAADVPGERWYGLIEQDWPAFIAEGEETRCVGDVLAAVAAESEVAARQAAERIEIEYEVLEPVLDPESALAAGAPRVNPRHENLLSRTVIRRGEAAAALAAGAHVVSGTWKTQRIEHYFVEPEAALAEPGPGGTLRLYTQGQGIFDDRRQVARLLGIPEERVYVELKASGGAFGGKEDLSIQAHAALLAWRTGRPVKLALDRRQSVRMHPKRHPIAVALTAACDAGGRLTAVRARMVGDSGAYASVGAKVLERAAGHACGPYRVPNVEVESLAVYTNNPPCGAMRGFGVPQAAFAIEGALDQLAKKAGLDGWEMRWRNAIEPGDALTTGQRLRKSVGIRKTLLAVKERYYGAVRAGRAVGIACGLKNSGLGNGAAEWGKARLVVEADGTISLHNGYTEMGQGLWTVLSQIAAEGTGLPAAIFRPRTDATFALGCGQTTGSRATLIGGRAVESAAAKLRAELERGGSLASLAGRVYAGDVLVDDTTPVGTPESRAKTHTSYGFATQVCVLDAAGRVERMIAAHDVGRAINPALCESQIQGAIHMGLGYALSEELPCVDGMPVAFSRYQLGIWKARDVPEMEVILVEEPEPEGPYGAKGLGEIGLVPTAAAVAGALEAFDGVRRTSLPMKDSPAFKALTVGRIRTPFPREAWR